MSYAMDRRGAKGTALVARKLIEYLMCQPDIDVTLIHYEPVPEDPLYQKAREIIMPKISLPYGSHFFSQLLFFLTTRESFDIIHWTQPRLYPFFWFAPARHIVVTAHGGGDVSAPGNMTIPRRIFNFMFTHFHRHVAIIFAVSESGKKEIEESYRIPGGKVWAAYNGVDERFAKERDDKEKNIERIKKYGLTPGYILTVGRLSLQKNTKRIIESYVRLRNDALRQEKLVIVGKPHSDYESIFETAKKSSYKNDIQFVSFVEDADLPALYNQASLFVFPSLNEGFGLPVVEAMASGTPVITSNTTSLPEIAGDAAELVDPENVDEIARAMARVLSTHTLSSAMKERGIKRASRFSWDSMGGTVVRAYRELCAKT